MFCKFTKRLRPSSRASLPSHSQGRYEILNDVPRRALRLEQDNAQDDRPPSRYRDRQTHVAFKATSSTPVRFGLRQINLLQLVTIVRSIIAIQATGLPRRPTSQHCTQDRPQRTSLSIPIDDFHTSWVRRSQEAGLRLVGTLLTGMLMFFCVVRILKEERRG